jgi:hypothetical protein
MVAKKPWFGPKRVGRGGRPQTWQGWVFVLAGVAVEALVIWALHAYEPGWIGPKPAYLGFGWSGRTWQGWVALLAPIVVFISAGWLIYRKQKSDEQADK